MHAKNQRTLGDHQLILRGKESNYTLSHCPLQATLSDPQYRYLTRQSCNFSSKGRKLEQLYKVPLYPSLKETLDP